MNDVKLNVFSKTTVNKYKYFGVKNILKQTYLCSELLVEP